MTDNPQPPWLYDLVTAIENHEDTHAKGAPCLDVFLAAVPPQVRLEAKAIAAYTGAKPTHATDTEHGPSRAMLRHEMDARDAEQPAAVEPALEPGVSEVEALLGSIWLYIRWREVTRKLTTEQKELFADAVDANSRALQIADGEEPRAVADRWWRDV